jgi:hypothetical protein
MADNINFRRAAQLIALAAAMTALDVQCFATDGAPTRSWWAFEDHGDKPGTGYVLIERGGKVERAHFFIFMPDPPEDESGRFLRMTVVKQEGQVLFAEINAFEGHENEEPSKVRIEFRDKFDDGKRVRAEITDPDKERDKQRPQDVVFVLQGDEWETAQRK